MPSITFEKIPIISKLKKEKTPKMPLTRDPITKPELNIVREGFRKEFMERLEKGESIVFVSLPRLGKDSELNTIQAELAQRGIGIESIALSGQYEQLHSEPKDRLGKAIYVLREAGEILARPNGKEMLQGIANKAQVIIENPYSHQFLEQVNEIIGSDHNLFLPTLSEEDGKRLIERIVKDNKMQKLTEKQISIICKKSGGRPFELQIYLDTLKRIYEEFKGYNFAKADQELLKDTGIEDTYEEYLNRLSGTNQEALLQVAAEGIKDSEHSGLSEQQISLLEKLGLIERSLRQRKTEKDAENIFIKGGLFREWLKSQSLKE